MLAVSDVLSVTDVESKTKKNNDYFNIINIIILCKKLFNIKNWSIKNMKEKILFLKVLYRSQIYSNADLITKYVTKLDCYEKLYLTSN